MTGPFRDPPPPLLCPRCGDLLERLEPGVAVCVRCEGVWLAQATLEDDGAAWPPGPHVWWRSELACPACRQAGTRSIMSARKLGEMLLDRCAAHGVWFDRGELQRVIAEPEAHAARTLRARLLALAPAAEAIATRRVHTREELDARRAAAEVERQRIEALAARQVASRVGALERERRELAATLEDLERDLAMTRARVRDLEAEIARARRRHADLDDAIAAEADGAE